MKKISSKKSRRLCTISWEESMDEEDQSIVKLVCMTNQVLCERYPCLCFNLHPQRGFDGDIHIFESIRDKAIGRLYFNLSEVIGFHDQLLVQRSEFSVWYDHHLARKLMKKHILTALADAYRIDKFTDPDGEPLELN